MNEGRNENVQMRGYADVQILKYIRVYKFVHSFKTYYSLLISQKMLNKM